MRRFVGLPRGGPHHRFYSLFPVNPPTGQPAHGPLRGQINQMASLGLPPWAAWCRKVDEWAMFRMSQSAGDRGAFLPRRTDEMDQIWGNEKVRERVGSSRNMQFMRQRLKYPHMKTGIWHSDTLDHWVQIPQVRAIQYSIEKDGGIDNFILNRSGRELKSKYGERLRRHVLVRQREIEKNFILKQHAAKLAAAVEAELQSCRTGEEVEASLKKYGMKPKYLHMRVQRADRRKAAANGSD